MASLVNKIAGLEKFRKITDLATSETIVLNFHDMQEYPGILCNPTNVSVLVDLK